MNDVCIRTQILHEFQFFNHFYMSLSSVFKMGVCARKKGQDRTGKKSQKGYISPICGEAPTEAMHMKICVVGDVLDVITYAKFQNEIFRGYNFTGGRIFHFSY